MKNVTGPFSSRVASQVLKNLSREGVIIDWPLKRLFIDPRDVILTSRNDIRALADDVNDDVQTLVDVINRYKTLKRRFMMFWTLETVRKVKIPTSNDFDGSKRHKPTF